MFYIILSFSFFLLTVILHIVWCRYKNSPHLQVLPFFGIAIFNLILYIVTQRLFLESFFTSAQSIWNLPLEMTSIVFFVLLIPFYLVFYYSVNIDSPSCTIISILKQNESLSFEQLKEQITNEKFIVSRLKDLVEHHCVSFDGKNYRLLAHMTIMGRLLNLYQKLTGRPIGG